MKYKNQIKLKKFNNKKQNHQLIKKRIMNQKTKIFNKMKKKNQKNKMNN